MSWIWCGQSKDFKSSTVLMITQQGYDHGSEWLRMTRGKKSLEVMKAKPGKANKTNGSYHRI